MTMPATTGAPIPNLAIPKVLARITVGLMARFLSDFKAFNAKRILIDCSTLKGHKFRVPIRQLGYNIYSEFSLVGNPKHPTKRWPSHPLVGIMLVNFLKAHHGDRYSEVVQRFQGFRIYHTRRRWRRFVRTLFSNHDGRIQDPERRTKSSVRDYARPERQAGFEHQRSVGATPLRDTCRPKMDAIGRHFFDIHR